ncbi:hypothetical protein [Fischerella sp. PCC 9605]|uniref:hypothetical protein n=1 Tax=Fischerella sp. PCC 9605 TaxID=1173024 RepID=UPI000478AA55|nr:hypothetical protein [Fischerella sp. PCC 9605]
MQVNDYALSRGLSPELVKETISAFKIVVNSELTQEQINTLDGHLKHSISSHSLALQGTQNSIEVQPAVDASHASVNDFSAEELDVLTRIDDAKLIEILRVRGTLNAQTFEQIETESWKQAQQNVAKVRAKFTKQMVDDLENSFRYARGDGFTSEVQKALDEDPYIQRIRKQAQELGITI